MSNHRKINSKPFQEAVYWVYVYVGLLSHMIGTIHFIRDMPEQVGGGGGMASPAFGWDWYKK